MLVTILFAITGVVILLLFPELKQKPRDAIASGGILLLAFVLTLLYTSYGWPVTIDELLTKAFDIVAKPLGLPGR